MPGENVLAVIVLNGSLGSSDLVFAAELLATELTPGPPTIASVSPVPGVVNDLREIRVTFDKPVTGVTAQQFLINGQPSSQVSGTGSRYTFTFPQPTYGTVAIGWGTLHEIQDLGTPPQRFSISSPGSSWSYELLDPEGPSIARRRGPFDPESARGRVEPDRAGQASDRRGLGDQTGPGQTAGQGRLVQ